jgi:putative FmdB family regulatory protein
MPLYEYKCSQCGQVYEVLQKFADKPLTVHEGCGGAVERLISTSAFQFKGTGFYITDYAKKHSSSAPHHDHSSSNGSNGTGESGSSAASGSKPAESSSAKPVAATSDQK